MKKKSDLILIYLNKIKPILGANYIEDTDEVLQEIIQEIMSIACDISNRNYDDEKLFPYISKAVRAEYLVRGAEGLTSNSEGSISNSFDDIIEKMRSNITKNGVRRLK